MPATSPDDSGALLGAVLAGRYRIDGVLGNGGMARVYRGQHTAAGKRVAVKVLHSALGHNKEASTRFEREAVASGRLDHPNIIRALDCGALDDGRLYIVMEALQGEHLGDRLARRKRLPWSEALSIMRDVLRGLRHAHARGVIHRDVKPDNIFLAEVDGTTIVKVLDFGIAKLFSGTDDRKATQAGITVGTPTYLSPEQASGAVITPASDIYSASIVLYELLVGRAPFESTDPVRLMQSHVVTRVPKFRELAPDLDVPAEIEELVLRGLAKKPEDRIDSARYIQAIDSLLGGQRAAPRPALPSPAIRVRPRRRAIVFVIAAACILAGGFVALRLRAAATSPPQLKHAAPNHR